MSESTPENARRSGRPNFVETMAEIVSVAMGRQRPPKRKHRRAGRPSAEPPPAPEPAAPPRTEPAPLRAATAPRPPDDAWATRDLSREPKLLLVDDDPTLLRAVASVFQGFRCRVFEAHNGRAGLSLAHKNLPDLIILDYKLPDCNGFQLMRTIRQHEGLQTVPVIMITGSPQAAAMSDFIRHEVCAYLQKPATAATLLAAAQRALGGRLQPKPLPGDEAAPPRSQETPPAPMPPAAPPAPAIVPISSLILPPLAAAQPPVETRPEKKAATAPPPIDIEALVGESARAVELITPASSRGGGADLHCAGPNDAPVIKLVNGIIGKAVERKASDIHIEPQEESVRVRMRIDGELYRILELPPIMASAVTARIKIMSSLDISERRVPQDGRFRLQLADSVRADFRVSTLPCKHGEKIVMRILGRAKMGGDLGSLRLSPRNEELVRLSLASPNGLILVTGPTGSGKTTTLYTMIASINTPNRNVMTVEDPVEYELPGISQVAANPEVGLTFATALRAFLRQDPDIILVGEIRDTETADIAVKAAATGHLVLSTLHTNDAATTVSRLLNMGVPPYMFSAALRLVIAQRLVRLLCPRCRVEGPVSETEERLLTPEELVRLPRVYRAQGCPSCDNTGYKGRAPVMEVMPIRTPAMRELINRGACADEVQTQALAEKMLPLRAAALELVERGETSLAEAQKIIVAA